MTSSTSYPLGLNPAYLPASEVEELNDFVLWLVDDENETWATLDYDYRMDCGNRLVSAIVSTHELSRSECEEAIRHYFPNAMFEKSLTINYKR